MATIEKFEDIKAWQKAREITKRIYKLTSTGPFRRDFGLRDQIRRAAVSIMSNIAEGFERGGDKEFVQFLSIAKGSAGETKSQLYVALDAELIDQKTFDELYADCTSTSSMLGALFRYLRDSKTGGIKFK